MDCPLIKFSNKEYKIVYNILNIFRNQVSSTNEFGVLSNSFSFDQIKKLLRVQNCEVTDEEIYKCIQYLHVTKGMLVRDNFVGRKDEYRLLLDERFYQSSYQEFYQYFENVTNIESIILISDTHIGNKSFEDYEQIRYVYDYAKKNNTTLIFHLGDLFDKMCHVGKEELSEIYLGQLTSFIDNYPNDVMTYCVLGNHDIDLNTFFQRRMMDSFDLRGLSYYNPNFYMFPKEEVSLDIGGQKVHFAHRLYLNWLIRNMKIRNLDDIYRYEGFNSSSYDIHICGHLHEGFICTIDDDNFGQQNLYIGVPSLSKKNNGVIAIQLDFSYLSDNSLESLIVSPLCIGVNQVVKSDEYVWFPKKVNKEIRKVL